MTAATTRTSNSLKRLAAVSLLIASGANLAGCIEAAFIGGTAAGVLVATDRRQPEIIGGDERVEWTASVRINERYQDKVHVNVTSYNYATVLTGEVPDAKIKADIERVVMQVPQVKNVVNEIQVAGMSTFSARGNDSFLTGKVKGGFVSANKFSANHVKVVTEAGVVYLLGLVTRQEADDATNIARTTSGVLKVVRIFEYISADQAKR